MEQLFCEVHQIMKISIGLVKFQHRKFWIMNGGNPFISEIAIDFEHSPKSAYDEALEIQLWGSSGATRKYRSTSKVL
jgi:hypothetical protein